MLVRFHLVIALLLLTACGGERASSRVEAAIGRSGGEVAVHDGPARGARIIVPPGAVDAATQFMIRWGDLPGSLVPGHRAIGPMITLGPEGSLFASPVRIEVPADREPMVLLTRAHGSSTWTRVDGAVWDPTTGLIRADVLHFSDFVPVEEDEPVADGGVPDGGDYCTMHPRDPGCIEPPMPLPGCDAVAQDCPDGEMCIAADAEGGYDWGDGRDARCIPAGTRPAYTRCEAPSDCAPGTQCVFSTMYDSGEGLIWFSQEEDYLPMHESFCLSLCAHATGCGPGDVCHPVQLWGFSGREVNEVYGVCAPPPPDSPPRP
jgi:hypothetical protein